MKSVTVVVASRHGPLFDDLVRRLVVSLGQVHPHGLLVWGHNRLQRDKPILNCVLFETFVALVAQRDLWDVEGVCGAPEVLFFVIYEKACAR